MDSKSSHFNEIIALIYKTALFAAIEKENRKIVKLLLTNDYLDINVRSILLDFFLIKLKIVYFNGIQKNIFQFYSKLYVSMKFKIVYFNRILK